MVNECNAAIISTLCVMCVCVCVFLLFFSSICLFPFFLLFFSSFWLLSVFCFVNRHRRLRRSCCQCCRSRIEFHSDVCLKHCWMVLSLELRLRIQYLYRSDGFEPFFNPLQSVSFSLWIESSNDLSKE